MIEMVRHNWKTLPQVHSEPDFNNILSVLARSTPLRPTLFEFFLNDPLYARLAGDVSTEPDDLQPHVTKIMGFRRAGYDYATILLPGFSFLTADVHKVQTVSLNEGAVIRDRASFDAYVWPDPAAADYKLLHRLLPILPRGMKLIVHSPFGVLENVIRLVGYENLCFMSVDDEALVADIFEGVGSRLVEYYKRCVTHEAVGAIIGNDDWGFKSQTMLPPEQMRKLVFPWHREWVQVAHHAGKPAILHSCGMLTEVMDDIIDDMKYDGKHSYEDAIQPVEEAYDQYHDRIAILGGIDLDFVCRSRPEAIYDRSSRMLARGSCSYALGTGNSVPEYVPVENYVAMIQPAIERRR